MAKETKDDMNNQAIKILFLEDSSLQASLIQEMLAEKGIFRFEVVHVKSQRHHLTQKSLQFFILANLALCERRNVLDKNSQSVVKT